MAEKNISFPRPRCEKNSVTQWPEFPKLPADFLHVRLAENGAVFFQCLDIVSNFVQPDPTVLIILRRKLDDEITDWRPPFLVRVDCDFVHSAASLPFVYDNLNIIKRQGGFFFLLLCAGFYGKILE